MFNIVKWADNAYQIIFEGTSFYFVGKTPVAFRLPKEKRIFIRKENMGRKVQNFVDQLNIISSYRTVNKPVDEFKRMIDTAYTKAVYSGTRRLAMQRMHSPNKEKGEINKWEQEVH